MTKLLYKPEHTASGNDCAVNLIRGDTISHGNQFLGIKALSWRNATLVLGSTIRGLLTLRVVTIWIPSSTETLTTIFPAITGRVACPQIKGCRRRGTFAVGSNQVLIFLRKGGASTIGTHGVVFHFTRIQTRVAFSVWQGNRPFVWLVSIEMVACWPKLVGKHLDRGSAAIVFDSVGLPRYATARNNGFQGTKCTASLHAAGKTNILPRGETAVIFGTPEHCSVSGQ